MREDHEVFGKQKSPIVRPRSLRTRVRRKDGKCLIVEIKDARFKAATEQDVANHAKGVPAVTTEGRKAVARKKWEKLNPDRLKYQIIFADGDVIPYDQLRTAREFAAHEAPDGK